MPEPRGLLFRARHGTPFTGVHWQALLERAGLRQDEDNLHFHALRHFAASWWIHSGFPVTDVASLMGHAKFDVTLQIYAHPIVGGHRRGEAFEGMAGDLLALPTCGQGVSGTP